MGIDRKLQIRSAMSVAVLGLPSGVDLELADDSAITTDAEGATRADVVIAFVRERAALDTDAAPAIAAALEDRLAWIAYPKSGQLGTDLNRDVLAGLAEARGVQPVRQIAVDSTWSALRFRPLATGER
jgi:hypothetical protein